MQTRPPRGFTRHVISRPGDERGGGVRMDGGGGGGGGATLLLVFLHWHHLETTPCQIHTLTTIQDLYARTVYTMN